MKVNVGKYIISVKEGLSARKEAYTMEIVKYPNIECMLFLNPLGYEFFTKLKIRRLKIFISHNPISNN